LWTGKVSSILSRARGPVRPRTPCTTHNKWKARHVPMDGGVDVVGGARGGEDHRPVEERDEAGGGRRDGAEDPGRAIQGAAAREERGEEGQDQIGRLHEGGPICHIEEIRGAVFVVVREARRHLDVLGRDGARQHGDEGPIYCQDAAKAAMVVMAVGGYIALFVS